ncbi:MAG: hypothetical protein Q9202_006273 [Teloschistes flavicans]
MEAIALIGALSALIELAPRQLFDQYSVLRQSYGHLVAIGISLVRPNIATQYERVETLILRGEDEPALAFRQAVTDECNMNAVAGAIIAQVAITGLSLPNLSATHCCVLQRTIGQLYSPALIRDWLSLPSEESTKTASLAAIFILSAPFDMMKASIFSFLISLAIYQGFTWTRALDTAAGPRDSRNVFIFFVVGTGVCGFFFSFTFLSKYAESLLRSDQRLKARSSEPVDLSHVADNHQRRYTEGQVIEPRHNRYTRTSEDETMPAEKLSAILEAAAQAHTHCAEANQTVALAFLRAARGQQDTMPDTSHQS